VTIAAGLTTLRWQPGDPGDERSVDGGYVSVLPGLMVLGVGMV
jgi:hypothetical protein